MKQDEIYVQNLEANISRLIKAFQESSDDLKKAIPERDHDEILHAMKKLKAEPVDLKGTNKFLSSIEGVLKKIKEKEITFETKDLLKELTQIRSNISKLEMPDLEATEVFLNEILVTLKNLKFPEQKEVQFPKAYPLPLEQIERLKPMADEESRAKLSKVIELLKEIRLSSGGGGGTEVVALKNSKSEKINPATEETLSKISDDFYDETQVDSSDPALITVDYLKDGDIIKTETIDISASLIKITKS